MSGWTLPPSPRSGAQIVFQAASRLACAETGGDRQFAAPILLVYVEYGSGEREPYDLAQDAHQLGNLADDADPVLVSALSARLVELAECTSAHCRELEDLPLMAGEPSLVAAQQQ
jgi:hypothetical protein